MIVARDFFLWFYLLWNIHNRINDWFVLKRHINHHTAVHIIGEMQTIVPKSNQPMPPFRNGFDAATRISTCLKRCIKICRGQVVPRKSIRVVLYPYGSLWDRLTMVGGDDANFGRKRYFLRPCRATRDHTQDAENQQKISGRHVSGDDVSSITPDVKFCFKVKIKIVAYIWHAKFTNT